MKTIKSVSVGSFAAYGAVLAAFWTFVFGLYYWILGWIFGAQSWWIDMNLGNWTMYTMYTFWSVFVRALLAAAGGALAGLVVALVYNFVAGVMGGIKVNAVGLEGKAAVGTATVGATEEARTPEPAAAVVESPTSVAEETAAVIEAPQAEAVLTGNVDESDVEEMGKFKNPLEYVEGIGPAFAAKLKAIGLITCLDLLKAGASRKGREEIAKNSGIADGFILKWVNHVDLYRIKGVGSEYADLLEVAGVDTVVELAQRNSANLFMRILEVNMEKKLVRRPPVESQVEDWVNQAKGLPRIVTY